MDLLLHLLLVKQLLLVLSWTDAEAFLVLQGPLFVFLTVPLLRLRCAYSLQQAFLLLTMQLFQIDIDCMESWLMVRTLMVMHFRARWRQVFTTIKFKKNTVVLIRYVSFRLGYNTLPLRYVNGASLSVNDLVATEVGWVALSRHSVVVEEQMVCKVNLVFIVTIEFAARLNDELLVGRRDYLRGVKLIIFCHVT